MGSGNKLKKKKKRLWVVGSAYQSSFQVSLSVIASSPEVMIQSQWEWQQGWGQMRLRGVRSAKERQGEHSRT